MKEGFISGDTLTKEWLEINRQFRSHMDFIKLRTAIRRKSIKKIFKK